MRAVLRLIVVLALTALVSLPATSLADDDDDDRPEAGPVTVSEIGSDSARVAATLKLDDDSAWYRFEYATLGTSWRATPFERAQRQKGDKGVVPVTRTLTGLPAATTIFVRLVAYADDERSVGQIARFTTAAKPTTAPAPEPAPADPAPPVQTAEPTLGSSFVAGVANGDVKVRLPGSRAFVALQAVSELPVGTVVDARAGAVALTTALPGGASQQASFGGAKVKVRQRAAGSGVTDLHLRGGSFARCSPARRASAAAAGKRRRKRVRRVWGKDDGGRFRTHGRDSVTTVRGTAWSVVDRCDGTLTRVTEGAVDVRVRRTGRIVRVDAGEHFLARHRR